MSNITTTDEPSADSTSRISNNIAKFRQWLYKRHPLLVPVTTFIFLFIVVSFGLVLYTGETVGADDKNIVKLTIM